MERQVDVGGFETHLIDPPAVVLRIAGKPGVRQLLVLLDVHHAALERSVSLAAGQLQPGNPALVVLDFDQLDIWRRVRTLLLHVRHHDLLHQAEVMRVDRIEPVDDVAELLVRRAVAQREHRVELAHGRLREPGLHVLRLVHDDDRMRRLQIVDRLKAVQLVACLVDDARVRVATDRVDRHDHDLHVGRRRERLHLLGRLTAVDRRVEGDVALLVQVFEVRPHEPDARVHALTDRHARHKDHELREVVLLRQLEDGAEVHVRLTCARLHLDVEVERRVIEQLRGNLEAVLVLYALQVGQHGVPAEHQPVTDGADLLREVEVERRVLRLVDSGDLAAQRRLQLLAVLWLSVEQVDDRLDRVELVGLAGVELESAVRCVVSHDQAVQSSMPLLLQSWARLVFN